MNAALQRHALPGASEAAAERRQQAFQLRIEGNGYRAIAKALGVSLAQAHKDVAETLRELSEAEKAAAVDLRKQEAEKLDNLFAKIYPKAAAGDPKAVQAAVRVIERKAKLLGLDAPVGLLVGAAPEEAFKTYVGIDPRKEPVPGLPAADQAKALAAPAVVDGPGVSPEDPAESPAPAIVNGTGGTGEGT